MYPGVQTVLQKSARSRNPSQIGRTTGANRRTNLSTCPRGNSMSPPACSYRRRCFASGASPAPPPPRPPRSY
jgi:hypothetical protein